MDKINVGIVGLGKRGYSMLGTIMKIDYINIVAVCDEYQDRNQRAVEKIKEGGRSEPIIFNNYKELINSDSVNTVLIYTSWDSHIEIAIEAMKCNKAVGMEVGGASSILECYKLVETWEKTKVPFMMFENCCFGKKELHALRLVREGILGDIVYCHGAYGHDLRKEVTEGKENRHYRLYEYKNRNCENYPTHELGPIAKILDINCGNKMNSLVSIATKSLGLKKYISDRKDTILNKELLNTEFKQGDIVETLITCENGEVISLKLDTTLPRSYSRELTVRGTNGLFDESCNAVFIDGDEEFFEPEKYVELYLNSADKKYGEYIAPYWKNITEEEINSGHGGMDAYTISTFFDCLKNDKQMPVDVYDAASWMAVTPLSEESIKTGMPVEFPDFTKGEWKTRKRRDIIHD